MFGVVFFVSKSLLGTETKKKLYNRPISIYHENSIDRGRRGGLMVSVLVSAD